jgi:hypothetical protein
MRIALRYWFERAIFLDGQNIHHQLQSGYTSVLLTALYAKGSFQ